MLTLPARFRSFQQPPIPAAGLEGAAPDRQRLGAGLHNEIYNGGQASELAELLRAPDFNLSIDQGRPKFGQTNSNSNNKWLCLYCSDWLLDKRNQAAPTASAETKSFIFSTRKADLKQTYMNARRRRAGSASVCQFDANTCVGQCK